MTELTLQVLGSFRVRDAGGGEVRIASRKGRALLAYLALRPGESHSRDRLANLLWEDVDEELARTSLRQALAALRKALPVAAQAALRADTNPWVSMPTCYEVISRNFATPCSRARARPCKKRSIIIVEIC